MPHHKTVCLLLAALMLLPSANCVHINTRIVMKAKNTVVEKITADIQDASSNNNFSPFVLLPPQVWNFNAFVGTREDPHQRGQMISFSLEVDSGDTWIRQQSYDGSESPTFKSDPTKPFDMVVDLFGTVKGYAASDDMNLIGYDFNFTAQPFGLVTDDSHYSPTWDSAGKLGLAWPGAGSPTVHTSLATSLAPLKRFTISFDQQDPLTSYALFGQVDCDNCRDDWAVVPLAGPQNYWQFSLLGLCASDGFCLRFGENRLAMLSNRVQFIHGPSAYISEFAKNVGATQQVDSQGRHWYQIECSRMPILPNIKLKLQHNQFLVLSPNDYAKEVQGNCVLLFAHIESSRSLLYARNVDWVIGLPVLRPYCQLYDIQRKELAFGRAQNFADAN